MGGIVQPTSSVASMPSSGNATCTFSRTFPNCGTYFFRHVSSAEEDDDEDDILDNDTISTSLLSSSSLTPRPAEGDVYNTNISPLVTSSPLKSDSDSHLPDFDLDKDDEDLDLASVLDRDTLFSAGLNVSDDLNITDGNGRLVPILDFSYINNEDVDLEAIIDSPESSRRKSDIKKLVGDAEKLLFQTVSFTSDESEFEQDEEISSSEFEHHNGAASASELTCYQSTSRKNSIAFAKNQSSNQKARNCQDGTKDSSSGYKRSHSFHNYYGSYSLQSEEEPKKDETSVVLRRKHSTNKLDGPTLISSGRKTRGNSTSNLRNSLNINNNNSNDNDYGCDASGEVTSTDENDSECQDEEMKSQHNHSAYSLVLVDDIDDFDDEAISLQSLSPRSKKQKEKCFGSQTIKEEVNNSNEADDTITNTTSPTLEPVSTSEEMSPRKSDDASVEATPRSILSSETTNTTPRSGVRRSGPPGCYSFRALPQTPSGTPRGMRAYIRSHTFPKGSKKEDEEELSEYWDQEKYLSE